MRESGDGTQLQCSIAIETAIATVEPGTSPGSAALLAGADGCVLCFGTGARSALLAEVLTSDYAGTASGAAFTECGRVFGLDYERATTLFAEVEVIGKLKLTRRAVHKRFSPSWFDPASSYQRSAE